MKYALQKGNNSVYSIQFHSVACVKYRRKALVGDISRRIKIEVAAAFGIAIC